MLGRQNSSNYRQKGYEISKKESDTNSDHPTFDFFPGYIIVNSDSGDCGHVEEEFLKFIKQILIKSIIYSL